MENSSALFSFWMGQIHQFFEEEDQRRRRKSWEQQNYFLSMQRSWKRKLIRARKRRKSPIIWSKKRSAEWWENIVLKTFSDSDWIKNFRVTKTVFYNICDMVRPDLEPKPQKLKAREPISVEKKVAVALYKLASCAEMRLIGNNMGLSTPSVHRCIRHFCDAMLKHVSSIITMPSPTEAEQISKKFEESSHIPQILLVIDGTHVPVLAPKQGGGDFRNRKGWSSYNCQIVSDANYLIRDVSCKFPGGTHDAYVLKHSGFYKNIDKIMPSNPKNIGGVSVDYMVIGDPAYPLLRWLMKGFSGQLTEQQESFNAYMDTARITVENTIGKLKSRWRILKKVNEMDFRIIPKIVLVCCMLHNIVEKAKVPWTQYDDHLVGFNRRGENLVQPGLRDMNNLDFSTQRQEGERIRYALQTITNKLPLRKQIII